MNNKIRKYLFITVTCLALAANVNAQKIKGLALTPPMGWNSWNAFQTRIDEKLIMDVADLFVSTGLKDAGYNYIVLDDGWLSMSRDSVTGNLMADPLKFPHGMKFLGDYIHSKGLKFGLYNCAGTKTCAGYPGTRGYEFQDAKYYASVGVDFLKFDWCNTEGINAKEAYTTMSKALAGTGRPIVFSMCEWGDSKPWEWAKDVAHMWRTTQDITALFDGYVDRKTWKQNSVNRIIDMQSDLRSYSEPDHWNDLDMLEVGNGLKPAEDRAHFSMWCMLAAPLFAGNDLRKMSAQTKTILTNKDAIAIDQDVLGVAAYHAKTIDSVEVWIKPLANNEIAVCFFNRAKTPRSINYNWQENTVMDDLTGLKIDFKKSTYKLYDIWQHRSAGNTAKALQYEIPAHDVLLLKLTR